MVSADALACGVTTKVQLGCREIQAQIDAEEKEKAEIKAKAKAMATALQTLGLIRIPKKVCFCCCWVQVLVG